MLKINRRLENPIYYGAKAKILRQAGELRKDLTKAEKKLWMKLRKKQLMGYKFRRQHAINQFVADFYCHNAKLVIEIDGEYHNISEQIEYGRIAELNNMGRTEDINIIFNYTLAGRTKNFIFYEIYNF